LDCAMARIVLTPAEKAKILAVVRELDPATHELTTPFKVLLSDSEWHFVVTYARNEIKGALEIGLLARAMAEAVRKRGSANEQGIATFLESTAWMRNFGVSDDDDERFKDLCGVDSPLFLAVDALLQLAQDRMFDTIDEEYLRLLESSF
jgi:hypothetical protein